VQESFGSTDVLEEGSASEDEGAAGKGPKRYDPRFDEEVQDDRSYKMPAKGKYDDEELDSDDAFNSDDEQKYGQHFENKQKPRDGKGPAVRRASPPPRKGFSLSEDVSDDEEEEEEDGSGSDADGYSDDSEEMDLSAMLQLRADEEAAEKKSKAKAKSKGGKGRGGGAANDGDDDELEEEDDDDDDDDDDARHGALLSSLSKMPSSEASTKRKKRSAADERGESRPEGAYNLKESSTSLGLDDLIGALKEGKSFGGLKSQVSKMQNQKLTLTKPVSQRETDQLTRSVAYKNSKSEVSKWTATVKANREAASLSFPLHAATQSKGITSKSSTSIADATVPQTELEKQVAAILESSTASEKHGSKLTADEELGLNNLDPQERTARVRELQKLRVLESYYASKCRRVKKIKSKSYHKILKKAAKRKGEAEELSMEQLRELDPEAAKEKELKFERERIENRAGLRHKNTGKWAKQMLGRREITDETRKAIGAQLQMDQDLRKKITLERGSDESSEGEEFDSDADFPMDEESTRAEVEKLKGELGDGPEPEGLYALKFMRKAQEKKRAAAVEELAAFEAELNGEEVEARTDGTVVGRRSYGDKLGKRAATFAAPAPKPTFGEVEGWGASEISDEFRGAVNAAKVDGVVTVPLSGNVQKQMAAGGAAVAVAANAAKAALLAAVDDASDMSTDDEDGDEEDDDSDDSEDDEAEVDERPELNAVAASANPWLKIEKSEAGLTPQDAMNQFTSKSDKRRAKLQRAARTDAAASAEVTVDLALAEPTANKAEGSNKAAGPTKKKVGFLAEAVPAEMEAEAEAEAANIAAAPQRSSAYNMDANASKEQKEMIAMAFAGDNVLEADFLKEKAKLVDDETEKDQDITLPGWGSWGGAGALPNKKPQKKIIKKAGPQAIRKDGKLSYVIISERSQKKTEKKMINSVPFPYTSKQQFERSIKTPTGKEWNSSSTLAKNVAPKVSTKAGAIIEPMLLTKGIKEASKRKVEEKQAKKGAKRAKRL
jgi:U3 small nucleolar RNA-associated protein 14